MTSSNNSFLIEMKCPLTGITYWEESRQLQERQEQHLRAAQHCEEVFSSNPLYQKHKGDAAYWMSLALGRFNCHKDKK